MATHITASKNGNVIELTNIHIIVGHDDSLPFNANLLLNGKQIGSVENNGRGADANIYLTEEPEEWKSFVKDVENTVWITINDEANGEKKHYYTIGFLMDVLAFLALGKNVTSFDWSKSY